MQKTPLFRLHQRVSALVLASFLVSAIATAQPSKEAKENAKALLIEGLAARDEKKDLKGALELFRKAHSIVKLPATGIEVARTLEMLGLFIEAEEAAKEVIALPKQGAKEPDSFVAARKDAVALAESAKAKIGFIKITINAAKPESVEVTIDDLTVAPAALKGPVKQNPGKHTVTAKGPKSDSAEVNLGPGETKEVTLNVKVAEKPKEEPPPPPAPPPPPPEKSAFLRPMPLVGFSLAGVGLIAGSVTGALTLSKTSAIKEACVDNRCPPSKHSDIDSAKTMGLVSTISFGVAGVGAAIGVVGILMAPKKNPETSLRVSPWVGVNSAGVVGQF